MIRQGGAKALYQPQNQCTTVMVTSLSIRVNYRQPSCAVFSCGPFFLSYSKLLDQAVQTFGPKPNRDAFNGKIHPLDQQPHDPRLLGREQLVPQRLKLAARHVDRLRPITNP